MCCMATLKVESLHMNCVRTDGMLLVVTNNRLVMSIKAQLGTEVFTEVYKGSIGYRASRQPINYFRKILKIQNMHLINHNPQ